jgi:DNA polymerase-3 subunit delta'
VTGHPIWELVVGHDEAVEMLEEAVAAERVTHAWLFTGPPGIGKLHTARVFAAALNCPAGGDGTCDSCRRILRGVHPDVHLIVPEGDNLLVEDVRAVREEASMTHHEAPTAVFILDEADRMTEAAANALLKVLEEPPPEVVFVLVARSAEALVGTVPSRARTLPFVSLSLAELTAALGHDLGVDPEQTAWAAAASHGRLARGRALLTDEAARTRRATVLDLVERLAGGQPSDALGAAATVVAIADEVAAAAKLRQERELAEFEEAFGSGRGTGALRKRLETRHRRELRRVRFDAIRDALADLLGAYRDIALLTSDPSAGGGSGTPPGAPAGVGAADAAGTAPLVHPDKAGTFTRLARGIDAATALRAAGALEEADRRLAIGAAPLLTLEAAFLSAQTALRGPSIPINRLAIRR